MLKRLTIASIILAGLIPAAGLIAGGAWQLALPCAGLAGLWLFGYRRGWDGLASWILVGLIVLAAAGVGLGAGDLWAPPAIVLALAAWDLHRFTARARHLGADDDRRNLERHHLRRLLAVSGLGLVLSWLAIGLRLRLTLAAALALGFLAIVGVSQLVKSLARESD